MDADMLHSNSYSTKRKQIEQGHTNTGVARGLGFLGVDTCFFPFLLAQKKSYTPIFVEF